MPDSTRLPFESATELREAHSRLLMALDQQLGEDSSEEEEARIIASIEPKVRGFLVRGAATGAYLDEVKNRTECQVLLDYWVSSLSRAGLQISSVRLAKFDEQKLPDLKDIQCPYVGLEAFRNQEFFFGREADTQIVVTQVLASQLVVVMGASGSGKSSLVMSGVLPTLAESETQPALRIVPIFVPGNTVLDNLVDAIHNATDDKVRSIAEEVKALRQDPSYLEIMIGGAAAPPTLIIIDQFEEVFTLSGSNDRKTLVASLAFFLEINQSHRVILTMREEFRNKIVELSPLNPYHKDNKAWYSMRPMGYEELRSAIEKPAALVNLQFQTGIVDDLVKKVLGQPAALPLLQFTLRELWRKRDRNRITWEVYGKVGDPLNALQSSADQFYQSLAPQTKDEVRRVLLELVRVDELLEAYRQPVPKSKLLKAGKANTEDVVAQLAANDFVRIAESNDNLDAVIEIKHESLIRNWPLFVEWIDEKRRERRERFALAQAADRWEKSDRPREGLLSGWQLQQAEQQSDLSNIEKEFIDASAKAIKDVQSRSRRKLIALFGLLLAFLATVFAYDHYYLQEWRRTWGEIDFLENMPEDDQGRYAENRLDGVAIYQWQKSKDDPNAFDELERILQDADRRGLFKPNIYKVTVWNAVENSTSSANPAEDEMTIFTLTLPKDQELSGPILQRFWKDYSKTIWDEGFPLPAKITIDKRYDDQVSFQINVKTLELAMSLQKDVDDKGNEKGLPKKTEKNKEASRNPTAPMEFMYRDKTSDIEIAYDKSEVLLKILNLDNAAIKLLDKYQSDGKARRAFQESKFSQWYWVPRWTIPIWKALGQNQFYPPEAVAVIHAVEKIRLQPELIFSDGFVAGLLRWQFSITPVTVKATCEATGGASALIKQTKDFALKNPLSKLEFFLDDLASKSQPPKTLATEECEFRSWKAISEASSTAFFAKQFDSALTGAVKPEPLLRVYIASNLQSHIAPSNTLDERVLSQIDKLRQSIQRDLGFSIPGVRFKVDTELKPDHYRIVNRAQDNTQIFSTSPDHEVENILASLHEQIVHNRAIWIDLEEVGRLIEGLPPNLKDWVIKNYSMAQLKAILQRVVSQVGNKDFRLQADEPEKQHQDDATLKNFSWLIRSLGFWKQVCKTSDYECLGDMLRETQQAFVTEKIKGNFLSLPQIKFRGIDSLVNNNFEDAEKQFNQHRRKSDTVSASREFVQAYGRLVTQTEYLDLEKRCIPDIGRYSELENLESTDTSNEMILAFDEYGHNLPAPNQRRREMCKILSQLRQASKTFPLRESLDRQFSLNSTDLESNEKYWLSYLVLKTHLDDSVASKDKAPPPHLDEIKKLLSETIRDIPLSQADLTFEEINDLCAKPTAGAWCLQILRNWPQLRPDSFFIPFRLAYASSELNRDGAYRALQLLDQAERNLSRLEKSRRQELKAWLSFSRGLAHKTLALFGVEGELDKAIQNFKGLTSSKMLQVINGPGADLIYGSLANALRSKGDVQEVGNVITEGYKKLSEGEEHSTLDDQKIQMFWSEGRLDEALEFFKEGTGDGSLFVRSISRLFGRSTTVADKLKMDDIDSFLKSSHYYTDYVRLLYYWDLMREGKIDKAKELLEDRWKQIDPRSWQVRPTPERGDYMAIWREMLIGYYLGKVPKVDVSELMENPSKFEASGFNNSEQSRQGFLCEWYFYDALFQSVNGEPSTQRSRLLENLEKAVSTNQMVFIEYSLAKNLIKRIGEGEDLTLQSHNVDAN